MKEEGLFITTGSSFPGAEQSQMFGKPCFKINGKAFCCFYQNCMVFKLPADKVVERLRLKDVVLFDPSGKQRPMKEWVQVPYEHHKQWKQLAKEAFAYVSG